MSSPVEWQAPEPEAGPAPGLEFADPGGRLVAYIVDILLNMVIVVALSILAGLAVVTVPVLAVLPVLAILIVPLLYFPYYWQRDGQTPGMRMMRIKVVRDIDGGPVSWGGAILRLIGYWVSGLVFYIGYIWIFIDKRRRGWHDLIAGTVVIKLPPVS
ncbi:MAG: RDD family protein [Chloroflexota bacterium]|jgi:uncharacterized RDD family membrane protein YckC|nr:RDD family protein [Chloroflexota bacterium]MDH5242467.1 RDD family protein [Chloroflexota bacterium]